jgi:hypothetical protein
MGCPRLPLVKKGDRLVFIEVIKKVACPPKHKNGLFCTTNQLQFIEKFKEIY